MRSTAAVWAASLLLVSSIIAFTHANAQTPGVLSPDQIGLPPSPDKTAPRSDQRPMTPQDVLGSIIRQLQTGTLIASWYGPEFLQYIQQQTGNTGVYTPLVQRGEVSRIDLVRSQPLPQGAIYGMIAYHRDGLSRWSLAISNATHRIEYGAFDVVPGTTRAPSPQPPDTPPGSDSEACRRFPNLC